MYCVKCKRQTGDSGYTPVVTKNGRPMIKSTCVKCGKRKCQFVSPSQIRQGGALGSLFGRLLSKVTAPLMKEGAKKILPKLLPALAMAGITGAISGATHKAAAN